MGPLYEEYAERILVAFYQAHQDPQYPGVRAHGLAGAVLAVQAGIVSTDEWQTRDYWASRKRWDIVAALRELIDRGFIRRTEDDTEDHTRPDQWNFRLTLQGKEYAHQLLSKGDETNSQVSARRMGMAKPVRIFISSTWEDLQPEREAVEKALHRMQDTTFAGMEYFGSRPETPKEASLAEVDRSHIYIGIFAHRYGSGITEAEYRQARERDIPCLIYFKDDDVPVPPAYIERDPEKFAKLEALKQELKQHHTHSLFKSPDHLATQVVADLHNLLGSAPTVREQEPSRGGPKYQITITDGRGIVIGDQTQVTQVFGSSRPSEQLSASSQSRSWLVQVRGEHRVYRIDRTGTRHRVPDGPTLETIARWEDVELLASWGELEKFPPERPLPSIVQGAKPWLVKVRGETGIYLIDEDGVRHRVLDQAALKSISQRTDVDLFATWNELERFQPGEPLAKVTVGQLDAETIPASIESVSEVIRPRLQVLADNIRQDLVLLNDYEDALRYEDDPRRQAKYRREIEQLRESAARYQREYDELQTQVTGEPSGKMRDVAAQLQQMDTQLDALLTGQKAIQEDLTDLRQALLARFDASEQTAIAAVAKHLDQSQLATIQAVLDAIEAGRVPGNELQETLTAVQQTLSEIRQRGVVLPDLALTNEVEQLAEVADAPKLDVKHKLKVTAPIIPLILLYEGEIELGSGLNLEAAWQRLTSRIRDER